MCQHIVYCASLFPRCQGGIKYTSHACDLPLKNSLQKNYIDIYHKYNLPAKNYIDIYHTYNLPNHWDTNLKYAYHVEPN